MNSSYPTVKELDTYKKLAKEYNIIGFSVAAIDHWDRGEKKLSNASPNKIIIERKKKGKLP